MVSFEPSEEQAMVKETIAGFATDQMEPAHEGVRRVRRDVSPDLVKTGWELEIISSCVPEEYGGFGEAPSALTGVIAYEELAHGDLSTAHAHLLSPTVMAYSVLLDGTDEQKKNLLPAFCGEEFKAAAAALVEPRYSFCPSLLADHGDPRRRGVRAQRPEVPGAAGGRIGEPAGLRHHRPGRRLRRGRRVHSAARHRRTWWSASGRRTWA